MKTKMSGEEREFMLHKARVIKAAEDLQYDPSVVHKLEVATTYNELTRIMKTARLKYFEALEERDLEIIRKRRNYSV